MDEIESEKPLVKRAEVMGFCMGVKRAIGIALKLASENPGTTIHTLGPIIHNPVAIKYLEEKGIRELGPSSPKSGFLIIRAHGVPPLEKKKYAALGYTLVDATCPRVLRSQQIVREHSERGFRIILAGDKTHSEVIGIKGYAPHCEVVSTVEEAEALPIHLKTMVIAQTTFGEEEFDAICEVIKKKNPEVGITRSICPATGERQKALKRLLDETDAVLVIGGKNSANTTRLYKIAKDSGKPAWHIESAAELPREVFSYKTIGITAGASTPDWTISEVEKRIMEGPKSLKIIDEIEKRRARRALDQKELTPEVLERIMDAAVLAPSCANKQPWRFLVLSKEPELSTAKEHLSGGNYWAKKAPVIVMVLSKKDLDCQLDDQRDYAFFDTGLAVMNLMLQATKEGLIAHPIAGFEPVPLKEKFNISAEYTLITLVIIGYPGDDAYLNDKHREQEHAGRNRKPMEAVVKYNRWDF